ncbi:MAG: hypothetical protein ACOCVF_01060 [bacterium]
MSDNFERFSAVNILDHFNKWRRGELEELLYTPTEIGNAIDIAIEHLNNYKPENNGN